MINGSSRQFGFKRPNASNSDPGKLPLQDIYSQLPVFWPHIPYMVYMTIVSYTSSMAQNDSSIHPGPHNVSLPWLRVMQTVQD